MLIAPVIIIVSGSVTVYLGTVLKSATESVEILGYFGESVYILLNFLPYLLTVSLFTVLYVVLPNTRVNVPSAFFGALFAALIFHLVEYIYLTFQVGVSRYNAIYGGFAALPLFLAWVQTNWLVLLLGAELSFAFQNQGKYEFEIESIEISQSYRFILSIAVIHSLIQRFREGEKGPSAQEISEGMQIPAKLVRRIINELVACRVVIEVAGENREASTYLPAIDIARLDINFVWRRLSDYGINEIPVRKNEKMKKIEETMNRFQSEIEKSGNNLLIKDL